MIPEANKRTVRLPVIIEKGTFKLLDGSPLPALRERVMGDLVVDADDLVNEKDREEWTKEKAVPFLSRGTVLWARVKQDDVPREMQKHVVVKREWPGVPVHVVGFALTADLELVLRAGKKAALNPCPCHIASLDLAVQSVNEAYAKISVAFEPGRRSHTGNVFLRVFHEHNDCVRPLDDLRKHVEQEGAGDQDRPKP